eukprot:47508-Eustigmatos_ZCMA.PRE.1
MHQGYNQLVLCRDSASGINKKAIVTDLEPLASDDDVRRLIRKARGGKLYVVMSRKLDSGCEAKPSTFDFVAGRPKEPALSRDKAAIITSAQGEEAPA